MQGTRRAALGVALAVVLAACGGDDGGTSDTTDGGGSGDGGAVSSLEDVRTATVQIVAQGTFAQPGESMAEFEEVTGAGSGSGFVIDPSGIAVTNNHVVTGAATLEVLVGGDDEPVNAKVLGVSECADLAVIDLDGDGYPYLEWADEPAAAGLEVYAAGFPLGDPEYTLLDGIVAKEEAAGETNWASVESVIEHTASTQPGNSGGPLVTDEGSVVGVNYAGGDPGTGTSQFFAIGADLAAPLVEQLADGTDVESLGVNGVAFADAEAGVSGIWVSSVDTNSPAGDLGLEGGDIVERIEGLPMGADGTMADYCDILRSHEASDQLAVQVLRFDDGTRYRGEFNGDELAPYESVIDESVDTGDVAAGTAYTDYREITDDSGILRVEVPVEWSETDGEAITLDDGTELLHVAAAPDLQAYSDTFDVPGLDLAAGADLGVTPAQVLDDFGFGGSCTSAGREAYDDGLYTGQLEVWQDCGGSGARIVVIGAEPAGGEFTVIVIAQLLTDADLEALDRIIQTFVVDV